MPELDTVTLQIAVCSPTFTIILAAPSATAVTSPLSFTVATDSLLDEKLGVAFISAGVHETEICFESPTFRVICAGSVFTDVTVVLRSSLPLHPQAKSNAANTALIIRMFFLILMCVIVTSMSFFLCWSYYSSLLRYKYTTNKLIRIRRSGLPYSR